MATGQRANPLEILGAWLGIWTPPRDVEVPPFPRRAGAVVAAGLLVVVALVVVLVVPAIDGSKDRRDAADAARAQERRTAQQARIARSQRARTVAATALLPAAGAGAPTQRHARAALLTRAQAAIHDDAVARARSGELDTGVGGRIGSVRCAPVQGGAATTDLTAARAAYDCFVPITEIGHTQSSAAGQIGYPFRAVLDWRAFRITWCKVNQIPGEQIIPDPRTVVALPAACRV